MKITDELLDKMADLAKLELTGAEREAMKKDFQKMLDLVDKLQEVDTTGIEPLIHITQEKNRLRTDEAVLKLDREDVLRNAPNQDGQYFRVPKVVKK
jgi:aspartyl-tRNA(Asn)/glutamyl-tRNA(Gln) amidotransferase subunit C